MRSALLMSSFILLCGVVSAMDKNDIKTMSNAGVQPEVVVKLAQDAKIVLTAEESENFRKEGVPAAILSILTVKPEIKVAVAEPEMPVGNCIISNEGTVDFYITISHARKEIIASNLESGAKLSAGKKLTVSLPNKEYKVRWNGGRDDLTAKMVKDEVTKVGIEVQEDTVYGFVYRDGEEQDSGYLWRRPRQVVVVKESPTVVVEKVYTPPPVIVYQDPPVYVVRQPVYVYPQPRSSLLFSFDFGHSSHRDYRHDEHHR